MSWTRWLKERRVERHTTSRAEIDGFRAMVTRDLKDARSKGTSADTRFIVAYNGALVLARMVVAASGYRIKGEGAHRTTFDAVELAMGAAVAATTVFFDACRRQRNIVTYDTAGRISEGQVAQLVKKVQEFRTEVESWLAANHPGLKP